MCGHNGNTPEQRAGISGCGRHAEYSQRYTHEIMTGRFMDKRTPQCSKLMMRSMSWVCSTEEDDDG